MGVSKHTPSASSCMPLDTLSSPARSRSTHMQPAPRSTCSASLASSSCKTSSSAIFRVCATVCSGASSLPFQVPSMSGSVAMSPRVSSVQGTRRPACGAGVSECSASSPPSLPFPSCLLSASACVRVRATRCRWSPLPLRVHRPSCRSQKAKSIFWQLDAVGLLLLVAGAGMVLVTITIANGRGSKWSDAHCIALLVVGGLCCIGFVLWERYGARHPLIPFHLLTNRTVIVCLLLAVIHPVAGGVIGGYFYTFLVVAANQSTLSATRITNIASFSGTLVVAVNGIICRYLRYLKPIVIAGFILEVLAFGLMIRFRESTNSQAEIAIVQLLRGVAGGCLGFPLQASIQSVTKHEHLGAVTAGYLTVYYLAGGVGSAIAGGI